MKGLHVKCNESKICHVIYKKLKHQSSLVKYISIIKLKTANVTCNCVLGNPKHSFEGTGGIERTCDVINKMHTPFVQKE